MKNKIIYIYIYIIYLLVFKDPGRWLNKKKKNVVSSFFLGFNPKIEFDSFCSSNS
jgi:hypothetical protein